MALVDLFSSQGLPLADIQPLCINAGGILVEVWGMDRLSAERDVAVMFFPHGRTRKKETMHEATKYILGQLWEKEGRKKDLLVVTLDSRNHGARVVDRKSTLGWEENPTHAVDLYAFVSGGASEISELITFLPAYLFPDSKHPSGSPITTWICAGVSQGGHTAWHVGSKDPRVTHVIPIIGSPDYLTLFQHRSQKSDVPLEPPKWPAALAALVRSSDPVNLPLSVWKNKRLLVMSGKKDPTVPYKHGGSAAFVEKLQNSGVKVDVLIDEDVGHKTTVKMVNRMVQWLWDEVLYRTADPKL